MTLRDRIKSLLTLRTFVVVSLGLFLVVSYDNTRQLAETMHTGNWATWLPWAFAGAVELGVVGLAVARIVRRRAGQDTKWFTRTLAGVLALSVFANFITGVESFAPQVGFLAEFRNGWCWWILPLLFAAVVPVLVFAFSELLATLEMERREQAEQSPRLAAYEVVVLRMVSERPGLSLKEIARALETSTTTAHRTMQDMVQRGLLERAGRGVYLPLVQVEDGK